MTLRRVVVVMFTIIAMGWAYMVAAATGPIAAAVAAALCVLAIIGAIKVID